MSSDVSVVIPSFNRARIIAETLESILAQTVRPAEIIVVDDGSTDDTAVVVGRYGGAVRYHRIENSGPGIARNVGVSLATGTWIAFCDSDDLWRRNKLERQLWLHSRAPNVEFSFTDFSFVVVGAWSRGSRFAEASADFWEVGRQRLSESAWVYDAPLYRRILRFQPMAVPAMLMTRRLFERLGGYRERFSRSLAEDLEFMLRCASVFPVGALAEPLVGVRKHPGNRSDDEIRSRLDQVAVLEYASVEHAAAKHCTEAIAEAISEQRRSAAAHAFAQGSFETFRQLEAAIGAPHRDRTLAIMTAIARLPTPLAQILRRAVVAAYKRINRDRYTWGSQVLPSDRTV